MHLTDDEKKFMLKLVRYSIKQQFDSELGDYPKPDYDILNEKDGVFVTITIDGNLRGCIGYIFGTKPLFDTLKEAAVQAAFHDPRFSPLTEEEVDKTELEISILSAPFPMKNYDEIEIGKHGLILTENNSRGLLLPQVPVEHNMNLEEYLSAICQKTGLPAEYWKTKTLNIELFTATVFSEN